MSMSVFGDEVVRATDLNRGSGEILNKAVRGPVTIVRNDECFALMRREVAEHWAKGATYATYLAEVVSLALSLPTTAECPPEYRWITAYARGDVHRMATELLGAYRSASVRGSWDEFDDVLHEWSESGWAALSPELETAFNSDESLVPIDEVGAVEE